MALAYRGLPKEKWLRSWLTSPKMQLSGPQCLKFDLYLLSPLSVLIGSHDNMLLEKCHTIWKSTTGLGSSWHHISLSFELPPEDKLYYFVFESRHWAENVSYTAALDNISVQPGLCRNIGERNFSTVEHVGFLNITTAICVSIALLSFKFKIKERYYYVLIKVNNLL